MAGSKGSERQAAKALLAEQYKWQDDFNLRHPRFAEKVDHPAHYGGAGNPYEAIKVIEAWGLCFHLGNTVKYISRAGKKGDLVEDLEKAAWYLNRKIEALKVSEGANASEKVAG